MGLFDWQTKAFKGKTSYGFKDAAERNAASVGEHAGRAATFITGGSGAKREAFMNSLGFLTKNQKREATANAAGKMAKSTKWLIPGIAGITAADTALDGGGIDDFIGDYTIPEVMAVGGWHAGKNSGYLIGGALGNTGRPLLAMGAMGGIAGGAMGLIGGAVAGYVVSSASESDNMVRETAHAMKIGLFNGNFEENRKTLTSRQRAMSRLSKSALNDRGQILGNEASILAGVY